MIEVNKELLSSLGLNAPTATATAYSAGAGANAGSRSTISTEAATGIGTGLGVPLLCTTISFAFLYLKERKKRRQLENTTDVSSQGQDSPSVGCKYPQSQYRQELDTRDQQGHSRPYAAPI